MKHSPLISQLLINLIPDLWPFILPSKVSIIDVLRQFNLFQSLRDLMLGYRVRIADDLFDIYS